MLCYVMLCYVMLYREQSLANNLIEEEIPNGKSLMYNRKSSGPSTVPRVDTGDYITSIRCNSIQGYFLCSLGQKHPNPGQHVTIYTIMA